MRTLKSTVRRNRRAGEMVAGAVFLLFWSITSSKDRLFEATGWVPSACPLSALSWNLACQGGRVAASTQADLKRNATRLST